MSMLTLKIDGGRWLHALMGSKDDWVALEPEPAFSSSTRVRCREIMASDLGGVIDILTLGFSRRWGFRQRLDRNYCEEVIRRLSEHSTPPGLPKYGYLLEANGTLVGVILLIFSSWIVNGATTVRCNGSSLYVAPLFTSYASLLVMHATRRKNITYINITPARHTWPMIEAQGYKKFAKGMYFVIPAICRSLRNLQIEVPTAETCRDRGLQQFEIDLLLAHTNYGCICVLCEFEGSTYPFAFALRRKYAVPFAHLIYCRSQQDFILMAGSLRWLLAKRGYLLAALDSDGPIDGLVGTYLADRPKYWLGKEPPRLGDLAYTEIGMFGC